jgi:hypothetical protein
MQNTVAAGQYTVTVAKKELPFGNNFTVNTAAVKQYKGKDELHCVVTCTPNSREPYMQYFCIYSVKGKLIACNN